MKWIWNNIVVCSIIIILSGLLLWRSRRNSDNSNRPRLPPGPKGWPVFGNVFDFKTLPHRSLEALKKQYGPIVWLNLGSIKTMVIQSADVAEELFKKHDISFADRYVMGVARSHGFCKISTALSPYSDYWRFSRRLLLHEIFGNKKIDETASIRRKCMHDMLLMIQGEVDSNNSENGIEVAHFVLSALLNMVGNMCISCDFVGTKKSEMASEFYAAVRGVMECVASPNISDLFPLLRWFDLQGLRQQEVDGISQTRKDFLDVLLDFKGITKDEPAKISDQQISTFIMELFIGGTETISTTVEWTMCELLRNPEIMTKIKAELTRVIGPNKKLGESDTDNLHYVRATIEETLRLHPPSPILIPRISNRDINFMGYNIPKGTQVLVNVWAIGRDPERWKDSLSFKPERFLDSNIRYNGQNFDFIPFGAGRRICPGLLLAHRLVPLILGTLLHQFDWELPENVTIDKLDITESTGLLARMLKPLKATPKRSIIA